jgi:hypothetical protein
VLWHIVLISFKSDAPEAVRQEVYERYQTLAEECGGEKEGILLFKVEHNLDLRKNVHLIEIAVFRSDEDLQRFRVHPKHKEITDILCSIADWQVGDIVFTLPTHKPLQHPDLAQMHFDPRN